MDSDVARCDALLGYRAERVWCADGNIGPPLRPVSAELCSWLPSCPPDALAETDRRVAWVVGFFHAAMPQMVLLDVPPRFHQPTDAWLALHQMWSAMLYHTLLAAEGADGPKRLRMTPAHGRIGPLELLAIDQAWWCVRDPGHAERLAQWFDIGPVQARAFAKAPDSGSPYEDADEAIAQETSYAFATRFYEAVADLPDSAFLSHPLNPLLRAWQSRLAHAAPYPVRTRASLPRIEAIDRTLPDFPPDVATPSKLESDGQLSFPGIETTTYAACPSWLLWLYDSAGGELTVQGRGAPWALRLCVGAFLHLGIDQRDGGWHVLRFPVFDVLDSTGRVARPGVVSWLHPDGWENRRRDWHRFPEALDAMRQRLGYIEVGGIGSIAMLMPTVIPRRLTDPFVEFTVRLPAPTANGARVDWRKLSRYGVESASLYRAYLSACAFLDRSAHAGHPVTRLLPPAKRDSSGHPLRSPGGSLQRDRSLLEPNPGVRFSRLLTEADLTSMIGYDPTKRYHRFRARQAFDRLDTDNVLDLHREGKRFRILGPRAVSPFSSC